ncbi:MAG: 50S ribosomal protein L23 [Candidatus Saccharibacteria bacterium]
MSKTISLRPRLSEKSYSLSAARVYVFDIPVGVNKHSVAQAVEAQFDVKVGTVNIANIPGKAKRVVSITGKRSKNTSGKRNNIRKAYVTLLEGFSLPFFAAVEEAAEQEKATQVKVEKAVAKQAGKTAKKAEAK